MNLANHPALSAHPEQQYLDLLRELIKAPARQTRNDTATHSVFGRQMRFDLADGFPLLTTKKVFWRGVVEELLWFISGSTDVRDLQARKVFFWDLWQDDDGTIGHGYGQQLRNQEFWTAVKPKLYEPPALETRTDRTVYGVGYYGAADKSDPFYDMLVNIWRQMIRRCYDPTSNGFPGYGAKGVHVDTPWHCFATFQKDAKGLLNWPLKAEFPDKYSIDKDTLWASNRYGRNTVMWADDLTQNANKSNTAFFTAVDPQGKERAIRTIGDAKRDHGLNLSAVHRCLNGKLHTHHGWSDFQYIETPPGQVLRYLRTDQLLNVLYGLKHDPFGRRHMLTLWNPGDLGRTTLPPCHGSVVQFVVGSDDRLNLLMHQRSGDMLLGVPVNIASYSLLLCMFAAVLGREPGEFVHSIGDAHLYSNHIAQAEEQVSRAPRSFPKISVCQIHRDMDHWTPDDIQLVNYDPWPAIRAEVSA